MKKFFTILFFVVVFLKIQAQEVITLPQHITGHYKMVPSKQYILNGTVTVDPGAVLTILAGTVIKGNYLPFDNSTLIISQNAKIYALGTPEAPIVFTSVTRPGSWGGITIQGNAPIDSSNNSWACGGNNPNDNSGIIKYVRIEYASAFILCGVGAGTEINHVQVSHSGDPFVFFGGTVNAYYLVAHEANNYFFATAYGHKGVVQFALGRRYNYTNDVLYSGMDNNINDQTFYANLTLYGESTSGYDNRAIIQDNYSKSAIFNSLLIHYTFGIVLLGDTAVKNFKQGKIRIKSNDFADIDSFMTLHTVDYAWVPFDDKYFYKFGNKRYETLKSLQLRNLLRPVPDARPRKNSPVLSGANTTDSLYKYWKPYLIKANYKGAFDSKHDWTKPWTEWSPETFDYCLGCPTIRMSNQNTEIPGIQEDLPLSHDKKILEQQSKLMVFPSPADEFISVRFITIQEEKLGIEILDQSGLKKKTITPKLYPEGYNELLININELRPGVYIVNLKGTKTQLKEKFVKK